MRGTSVEGGHVHTTPLYVSPILFLLTGTPNGTVTLIYVHFVIVVILCSGGGVNVLGEDGHVTVYKSFRDSVVTIYVSYLIPLYTSTVGGPKIQFPSTTS